MIFSCFHRYICVEGVVRCHNNIILGHFIKLLHILVLHLEYLDIILNLLKCSRNQKPCCSVLLHVCGNGYILPCDLCNRVYMKLQISSIRSLELSKQPPGILFWLLVFFFFLHTGNSTLDPETCRSIQPAAFLETTTSEVYFVRMWVAANTPILTGI